MNTRDALFIIMHPYAYDEPARLNAWQALVDNGEAWHRAKWMADTACAMLAAGKLKEPT